MKKVKIVVLNTNPEEAAQELADFYNTARKEGYATSRAIVTPTNTGAIYTVFADGPDPESDDGNDSEEDEKDEAAENVSWGA